MKAYGIYNGIVIQNNDPEKAGRAKVFVAGITNTLYENWNADSKDKTFSGIDGILETQLQTLKDTLPWAQNVSSLFGGGNDTLYDGTTATGLPKPSGSFSIPNVGTHTYVFFIGGDVNCPAFFGANHGAKAWTAIMGGSYPSEYENAGGVGYVAKHVISSNKHYVELIDDNGKEEIRIFSKKDRNCVITNNDTLEIGGNWDVKVTSNATIDVTGNATVTVTANATINVTGNTNLECAGTVDVHSAGALSIKSDSDIAIESVANVSIKGVNVNVTGSTAINLN